MTRKTVTDMPEILLVDDNPADSDLTWLVLARSTRPNHISAVYDGEQAMAFLHRSGKHANAVRPQLVVLDLNLPRKDGRAVLDEVKADPELRKIPVVIFTTSRSGRDIARCYELGANCYVSKPGNLDDFRSVVRSIEDFWFGSASLPN
jgi:two-component system, chemotaxis family, response regulator Rcp1